MKKFFIILLAFLAIKVNLFAAEAGMPQLDPKYWASQAFWLILVFTLLYFAISKFFIPKIKSNLDNRDNKIKGDIDEANNLKNTEIQNKKKIIGKEIEDEIEKAQLEIKNLKKNSIADIGKISEEITLKIIEEISGDKLNESSIKAAVSESSKKNMSKYL